MLLFGFLLNLPWELLQVPFFAGMPSIAHWDGVIQCVTAAAGMPSFCWRLSGQRRVCGEHECGSPSRH
ncbi:MAG: hypothetical protein M5R42_00350 [Rhodocyclaceae bacterium]|nr:hypothetical protein [Rhodocyclaceae bacterium]